MDPRSFKKYDFSIIHPASVGNIRPFILPNYGLVIIIVLFIALLILLYIKKEKLRGGYYPFRSIDRSKS